jgi:two-component system sensor kinase FixL
MSLLSLAGLWEGRNRTRVLLLSSALLVVIAILDWRTKPYFSLGFLYLFPIMLTARFLPRWAVVLVAVLCALLSEIFSSLDPSDALIRLGFVALALAGCGLFVGELLRNRQLIRETEERLHVLVETSPAAIVTVDEHGFIERANHAAVELMTSPTGSLVGQPIAAFLPELHYAVRKDEGPQFRTSMQCRGHRSNGESFLAEVWFSTYREGPAPKLAAIIADVTEERAIVSSELGPRGLADRSPLSKRESGVLRFLVQGLSNKEIASNLEISESAVKNTLQQLFAKHDVRTRSQLVRVALEQYRDLL